MEHPKVETKSCRDCYLWFCDQYLEIHKVFNEIHYLEQRELPLKEIFDEHSKYFWMECRKEIYIFWIYKESKHRKYKYRPFSKFKLFTKEIRDKRKIITLEECEKNLEDIRNKKIKEKKNDFFLNKIDDLLYNIKVI